MYFFVQLNYRAYFKICQVILFKFFIVIKFKLRLQQILIIIGLENKNIIIQYNIYFYTLLSKLSSTLRAFYKILKFYTLLVIYTFNYYKQILILNLFADGYNCIALNTTVNCSLLNVGCSNRKKRKIEECYDENVKIDEQKDLVPVPKLTNVCKLNLILIKYLD